MPINFSLRKYYNPVFVETGSFHGDGIKKALRAGFKKVYSIELNEQFCNALLIKFRKEIEAGRVMLVRGDSSIILPEILRTIDDGITFWLDAHYCGGDTAHGPAGNPLLMELDEIGKHHLNTHTILIDDVRLFGTKENEGWSVIRLEDVISRLKQINAGYRVRFEKGMARGDVLVAEIKTFNARKVIGMFEESTLPVARVLARWISRANAKTFKKEG